MLIDSVDGEIRVDVGLVVLGAVLLEDAVLVQREVGIGGGRLDERVELAAPEAVVVGPPARRDVGLVGLGAESVRHLADVDRPVARLLQPDRQVVLVVEDAVATLRRGVAHHVVVVRVLTGLDGDARGTAERHRDVGVQEVRSLRPDQRLRLRHRDQVAHRLIVGGEHDHVRLAAGRVRALPAHEQHEQDEAGDPGEDQAASEHAYAARPLHVAGRHSLIRHQTNITAEMGRSCGPISGGTCEPAPRPRR